MTIVESIKCVLQQNNDGLTSKQIYDEIIRQGLYSFGAENPVGVVNAQLRRRCIGLDFPTAYPIKFFEIAGYEGKKIKFRLISTENTATIITAPKTTDLWQKNKRDVLRLNGVTQSSEEKRYPLMKLYEHFFYCDLYLPREGDCEYSTLKFGENFCLTLFHV